MFYYNLSNLSTIKGQQKAYDYARDAMPFLYYFLNAELNSTYNGLYSVPVNSGSGRFCHAQFTLYANCLESAERKCGRFTIPAEYKQKQFHLAVETYTHSENFISIRKERISNLQFLTKSKEGILLLGNNYFSIDNSWMSNPIYYEDYERTWDGRDIEVTRKDGTKRIWHIRPHKNSYRKFNLYKLQKDGLIHIFGNNDIDAFLDYQKIDLSNYSEPIMNIKDVQWDFRKSQPLFYWKALKPEDKKDGQILDRMNTASEIYSIFEKHKKIKISLSELKKHIYNKVRSKNAREIKIECEDGEIIHLYVSDTKDKQLKAKFNKIEYQRQIRLKDKLNKSNNNNNSTASITSTKSALADYSLAKVTKNKNEDKTEYLDNTFNNNSLFEYTQICLQSKNSSMLKSNQATPDKLEVIDACVDKLFEAKKWFENIQKNPCYEYIYKRIETDEDLLFYYEQISR